MLTASPEARDRTKRIQRVLLGLLLANLAVVGAKFVIGLRTGSLAVLGDAVHSTVDAMNNVLALALTSIAGKAPDEDHPYGHRKFETLGALAIVMFLSISGFELVKGAVRRLAGGAPPALAITPLAFGILAGTLVVNIAVAAYEGWEGRRLRSPLLLADAAHTRADILITIGVLASVAFTRAGYTFVDPVVALVVGGSIAMLAYQILRRSIPVLVDEQAHPTGAIRAIAEGVAGVFRAYHIRSRGTLDDAFAELTIAVDGSATVTVAHEIADAVERRLRQELRLADVVVHVEPC